MTTTATTAPGPFDHTPEQIATVRKELLDMASIMYRRSPGPERDATVAAIEAGDFSGLDPLMGHSWRLHVASCLTVKRRKDRRKAGAVDVAEEG